MTVLTGFNLPVLRLPNTPRRGAPLPKRRTARRPVGQGAVRETVPRGGHTPKKTVSLVVATRAGVGLSGGLVDRPDGCPQADLAEHHPSHGEHWPVAHPVAHLRRSSAL